MPPVVIDVRSAEDWRDVVHRAVQTLAEGGLVAFPTETVYGLGADGLNPEAVARIYAAKGRPVTNPMILHVADVLSQYDFALNDPRFIEMLNLINAKASKDGLFTPESVWKAWEGWDFGQKTKPSPWVTFLVYRINERAGNYQKI